MAMIDSPLVVVIGDIMLDETISGSSSRLSPEAPVPIIDVHKSVYTLGGAGNVAANIASLGGKPLLFGVAGMDDGACHVDRLVRCFGMSVLNVHRDESRPTTVKKRIVANRYQIARLDTESRKPIDAAIEAKLVQGLETWMKHVQAMVVSDYAKGVVTPKVMNTVYRLAADRHIPVFIDPRVAHVDLYHANTAVNATITPNVGEAEGLSGIRVTCDQSIETVGCRIIDNLNIANVLITRGDQGMSLIASRASGIPRVDFPTMARNVFDVSGAGDTVIATLALECARGRTLVDAAALANKAAGIVVGKAGTAVVLKGELYGNDA